MTTSDTTAHGTIPHDRHDQDTPNPKEHPTDNAAKDPDDWVSGDDPMTGAQASYLKTLSEQAHQPEAYEDGLTKAEASKRIDALKERTQGTHGRGR